MIDPLLDAKVALVTGAKHCIGAVTVKAPAAQGARAFLTCFREPQEFAPEEPNAAVMVFLASEQARWITG
jgi:NADP-dependent 3-hydroxy acid dehydrogenase YdfG